MKKKTVVHGEEGEMNRWGVTYPLKNFDTEKLLLLNVCYKQINNGTYRGLFCAMLQGLIYKCTDDFGQINDKMLFEEIMKIVDEGEEIEEMNLDYSDRKSWKLRHHPDIYACWLDSLDGRFSLDWRYDGVEYEPGLWAKLFNRKHYVLEIWIRDNGGRKILKALRINLPYSSSPYQPDMEHIFNKFLESGDLRRLKGEEDALSGEGL